MGYSLATIDNPCTSQAPGEINLVASGKLLFKFPLPTPSFVHIKGGVYLRTLKGAKGV